MTQTDASTRQAQEDEPEEAIDEVRFDTEPDESALPDLDDPSLYLNSELTWLAFDRRVLDEARNPDNPLLEKLKFLAISDSNLDEFFMKRIGGLKQQAGAGLTALTVDGRSPLQQIQECRDEVRRLLAIRVEVLAELMVLLSEQGIVLSPYEGIDAAGRKTLRRQFQDQVLPLITPLTIDEAHPFPLVSNLSVNLLLRVLEAGCDTPHVIRIKVPTSGRIPRFMRLDQSDRYVPLEEVIANNLDLLLPGAEVLSLGVFRVTRNAVVVRDEEAATDLLEKIEIELQERRFAPVVRLEVSDTLDEQFRAYLINELELTDDDDVFELPDLLGARDLMQLATLDRPELHDARFEPSRHPRLMSSDSIFDELDRGGPLLVKHPYQSYDHSVTRLLREAVNDPRVLAIKTTVYRTSSDSAIVPLLEEAVMSGKQVAVVVELQARFDEAANIRWATRLEEAGIHVAYGVVGFKTHCKTTLIVRQASDGTLKRYVHVGTGNYHPGTARLYCDIGLFSADLELGSDATELFNLLTSGSMHHRHYQRLLVSPHHMKHLLLQKIDREIEHHRVSGEGVLQLKTNALTDKDVTRALYRAGSAGVKVDLLVRDSCRLRPGLVGLSESVRVISIVGRFLEHSRVYYFRNGGDDEYYIGSADLMTRNLERRVEALVPIIDPALRQEVRHMLDLQVNATVGAWEMDSDGNYERRVAENGSTHPQEEMVQCY